MILGIDIDDVLFDTITAINNFYNNKKRTSFKTEDYSTYSWWEIWGTTKEEAIKHYIEFMNTGNHERVSPNPESQRVIKSLSKNHKIILITGRPKAVKEQTLKEIKAHFPHLEKAEIYFTDLMGTEGLKETKVGLCKKLGVQLFIEDGVKYALEIANEGIQVLLFDKPWNQQIPENRNITRISSWKEVEEYIQQSKHNNL